MSNYTDNLKGFRKRKMAKKLNVVIDELRWKYEDIEERLSFVSFDKELLVGFSKKVGAQVIIRGLRAVSDFDYELQMTLMNRNLDESVETIFLMPSQQYSFLSSSIVKEVASLGGDVSSMVPSSVFSSLKDQFNI